MIRVLLVDDHTAFRKPLAYILEREPDLSVVAQAGSLAEARRSLEAADVAIVDLHLPDGHGSELVRELRERNLPVAVLVLSGSGAELDLAEAVDAGADGVLQKWADLEEIIDAVRRLGRGEAVLGGRQLMELVRLAARARDEKRRTEALFGQLTPRERDVLQALADGLSDKEIADRLTIHYQTVRTHVTNILTKLRAESRLQAVLIALRHGVVVMR